MLTPFYSDDLLTLHHGDCLDVLRSLPDASIDAVVTDPPYGISFMGKQWDQPGQYGSRLSSTGLNHRRGHKDAALEAGKYDLSPHAMRNFQAWCEAWATECLRVLKPGGHLLAFGGARTWHRLAGGIEDAGFEIRDSIAWLFGSGFPKSLDVSKAIDRAAGADRHDVYADRSPVDTNEVFASGLGVAKLESHPVTAAAAAWQGWGTALKPAFEPVVVARKPLAGTVAANVLTHGTGALNIDACRIGTEGGRRDTGVDSRSPESVSAYGHGLNGRSSELVPGLGRWPTNVVLDASQAAVLDEQSGDSQSRIGNPRSAGSGEGWGMTATGSEYADVGGASRFFYVAKADSAERVKVNGVAHPTVKPIDLMRWLIRLVTPRGGVVLEPFAGSGTTVEACLLEGFRCIAIEREADYLPLIRQRIDRRRDPVAAVKTAGEDGGLFDLLDEADETVGGAA